MSRFGSMIVVVWLVLAMTATTAGAQTLAFLQGNVRVDLDRINARLGGMIVDYTANSGVDRRIYSPVLNDRRDLYVYLPPGYSLNQRYPLVLFLHMALVDERFFAVTPGLADLDALILSGRVPPMVVACVDGTYYGRGGRGDKHSFYVNGGLGRFEDHILYEIVPFLSQSYAVLPHREGRALVGCSAGGFGAMSLGIRHRHMFGSVATLSGPLNLRYDDVRFRGDRLDFNPSTYTWKTVYDPNEVIASYYLGIVRTRARSYIEPVFGNDAFVPDRVAALNPADLLFSTGIQPGELQILAHYAGLDNFNFDAHAQSFAALAASRGIRVDLMVDPIAQHTLRYFNNNLVDAWLWLGQRIARPVPTSTLVPTVSVREELDDRLIR